MWNRHRAPDSAKASLILPELSFSGYQFVSTEEAAGIADRSMVAIEHSEGRSTLDACVVFGFRKRQAAALQLLLAVFRRGIPVPKNPSHYRKGSSSRGRPGLHLFEFRGSEVGMASLRLFFTESFRTLSREPTSSACSNSYAFLPEAVSRRRPEPRFHRQAKRVGSEAREAEALTFTGESVMYRKASTSAGPKRRKRLVA